MAFTFAGAEDLENTTFPLGNWSADYTFAGWVYGGSDASTWAILGGSRSGFDNGVGFDFESFNNTGKIGFIYWGVSVNASGTNSPTGTSHVGLSVGSSDTDVYVDGSASNVAVGYSSMTAPQSNGVILGCGHRDGAKVFRLTGSLAEWAFWSVRLTTAEMTSLSRGFSPLLIRPSNLVAYWPLVRDGTDIVGGYSLTNSGATVASHPRIIYPRRRAAFSVAAAAGGYSSSFFRENAGLGAAGAGPFARANAGLGAIA